MAVEYSLSTNIDAPIVAISRTLAKVCALEEIRSSVHPVTLVCDGVWCYIMLEDALGKELIFEKYGFTPSTQIRVRMDKFKYDIGLDVLLNISSAILNEYDCDLVILENGDLPLLLRKEGMITIDSKEPYWETHLINKLSSEGIHYSLGRLPLM